jgi:hypothetical protein
MPTMPIKLNARERTLALALVLIGFILLNLLFVPKLTASNRAARQKGVELKAQLDAAQAWVAKKDYWAERKKWLEETEPILKAAREESATQLELLQAAAKKNGLTIKDIELLQLPNTEFYQPVGARLTFSGPWPGFVTFVAGLQNPALFDVIPRFSVQSDQEPPDIQCEMEIQRWFHTPEGTPQ